MSPEEFIAALVEAFEARNAERVLAFIGDGIVFEDKSFHVKLESKQAMREMFNQVLAGYSMMKMEVHSFVAMGNKLATQQTTSGRLKTPGGDKTFSMSGASFYTLSGGKIVRWTDYYDVDTFRKQVGS